MHIPLVVEEEEKEEKETRNGFFVARKQHELPPSYSRPSLIPFSLCMLLANEALLEAILPLSSQPSPARPDPNSPPLRLYPAFSVRCLGKSGRREEGLRKLGHKAVEDLFRRTF